MNSPQPAQIRSAPWKAPCHECAGSWGPRQLHTKTQANEPEPRKRILGSMMPPDLFGRKLQEARGIVVEDIALLLLCEKFR